MNIEVLNHINRCIRPEIDSYQQIHARSSVNGMKLEIYYLLGDPEPIENLLRGFDGLRNDRKKVIDLGSNYFAEFSFNCHGIDDFTTQFYVRPPNSRQQQILVSGYGDLLMVVLPTLQYWRKAGLGWLNEKFKDALVEEGKELRKGFAS